MKKTEFKKRFDKIRKKKLIIGLTGQIGAGKSTALDYFASKGIFTVSTDSLSRKILTSDECYSKLTKRFGKSILNEDDSVNRIALSNLIFTDKPKRKWLEGLLHPPIFENTLSLIEKCKKSMAIVDAPLLFETGFNKYCDITVSVYANKKNQRKRLLMRGWTEKNIMDRIKSQFTAELKAELSDIVVPNDSSLKDFHGNLRDLSKILMRLAD